MQGHWSKIRLISRTIGADRGRAARGRPVQMLCLNLSLMS